MATKNTSSSNSRPEKIGDVLDALFSGIAKTAANEPKFEPQLLVPEVPAEPLGLELVFEKVRRHAWASSPIFRSNGWFRHPRRWRGQVPLSALDDPALNKYLTL
ncbi:MAG: hypothetical protein RLZZ454_1267 [Pseudomonadota bacterium]|jgi:hypothetical protein